MEKQPRMYEKAAAMLAVIGALAFAGCEETHQVSESGVYEGGKFYYPDKEHDDRFEASCQGDSLIIKKVISWGIDETDIFLDSQACNDSTITESDGLLPLAMSKIN